MVTTTVRMLDGIHRGSTDLRPGVALDLELVVVVTGLEDRLLETTSSSDDTDHGTSVGGDGLTSTGWKTDTGLLAIFGVTHDDAGGTGGAGDVATVAFLTLEGGDDGTFRHLADRKDVSDLQLSLLTGVDVLA